MNFVLYFPFFQITHFCLNICSFSINMSWGEEGGGLLYIRRGDIVYIVVGYKQLCICLMLNKILYGNIILY